MAVATIPTKECHEILGRSGSGQEMLTGLDSSMTDVNEEDVDRRLWRSDHVLCRRNKLNDRVVKLGALPSVTRLVASLVPVEQLRHLVRHAAHAASPAKREISRIYSQPTRRTYRFPPSIN